MIKWPYLPQDSGLEIVKSEGAYLYNKDGFKILMSMIALYFI